MADGARTDRARTDGAGFSSTDAALAGFEVLRREPLTVLVWSLVQGAFALGLSALSVVMVGPAMAGFRLPGAQDPAAMAATMQRVAPFNLLVSLLTLVLLTVIYAAAYRAVLRPDAPRGFGRLRLGGAEWRVGLTLLLLFVLTLALFLVALVALGIVAGELSAAAPALRALWVVAAAVTLAAGFVFVAVRLSLAPPMAFDTGRVAVFPSWRLTRGRFWALFGAYLVAGLLVLAMELALVALFAAVATALGGVSALSVLFNPDMTSLRAYFTPASIAMQLLGALISGLVTAVMAGAPAYAYGRLRDPGLGGVRGEAAALDLPRFGR